MDKHIVCSNSITERVTCLRCSLANALTLALASLFRSSSPPPGLMSRRRLSRVKWVCSVCDSSGPASSERSQVGIISGLTTLRASSHGLPVGTPLTRSECLKPSAGDRVNLRVRTCSLSLASTLGATPFDR